MKKHYLLLLLALSFSIVTSAQDLIITGVFDGNLSGGTPKAIELYVLNDIADLSEYGIGSANNGGGTDGVEFQFTGTAVAGDYIYVASEMTQFNTFFGFNPDFDTNAASINGDDAIELFNNVLSDGMGGFTGDVIDTYGQIDVNGDGTAWDYTDGWGYRNDNTGPDTNWVETNWTYSGIDANDDDTTQSTATNPWPLGSYSAGTTVNAEVNFAQTIIEATENDGTLNVEVTISETTDLSVDLTVVFTNDVGSSYTLDTDQLTFTDGGATSLNVEITLVDNSDTNQDYLITLELVNNSSGSLGDDAQVSIYVLDDESHAPEAVNDLGMAYETTIEIPGAEIVTHDATSAKLFVSNSGGNAVEVIDFSDPLNMVLDTAIDMSPYGEEVTSVSAFEGIIAVAVKAENQADGTIVFVDGDGNILSNVTVGSLPDMVAFSPDGNTVLVANEGEPSDDYTIDPEGTIAVIDLSGGVENLTQSDVTLLNFNNFDSNQTVLENAGVRIFGPNASVSQDLEPEFITIAEDGSKAFVALQENNAYAVVNLGSAPEISSVVPFGYKDHSQEENAFDVSNRLDFVFMSTWNTLGMYQPDAIATYDFNGNNYLVIANEGDARDYDGYSEEERVEDLTLDPTAYPNADVLQNENNLGRLKTTSATGDTDNDGDIDQIYSYGGRSFAIFNADNGNLVYDSGDLLERITKEDPTYGVIFNATDDENAFKNRSDDKGPEPEAVIVQEINDKVYAFIGLERIGGIAVFDITVPTAPIFETYVNNRDTTLDVENPDGDLAPEGVIYVAPEDNTTNKGLIVVANEVSSTISVYTLENDVLSIDDIESQSDTITIYPNPVSGEEINFSKEVSFEIYDILGRKVNSGFSTSKTNVSELNSGLYLIKFDNNTTQKIIIK